MLTFETIYQGAERLITELLRQEATAQGHVNTGEMIDSFTGQISPGGKEKTLTGLAVGYTSLVNDGYSADSVSNKQAPFLIKFFESKGYPYYSSSGELTAVQLAFATIKKWQKEGVPTAASSRFSTTGGKSGGSRQHMIEAAFIGGDNKINEYMSGVLDLSVDEHYRLTKTEII